MKVTYNKSIDKNLWDDFLSGDYDAFDHIYNDYMPLLYNYARKFTGNKELIEDVVQDFFVDIWYKRNTLGRTDNIKLYLFKSIRRRILRTMSKEKKKQQIDSDYVHDFVIYIDAILQKDDSGGIELKLNNAVNQLSGLQKEIIFLKFYNDCSIDEICEILSIAKKSVYNGLFNAMKSLRSKIHW